MLSKVIAFVYDEKRKPETIVFAKSAIKELSKYKDTTVKENPDDFYKGIDAVIVYGGDGLLLHTANRIAKFEIPIIGVNYGRVGYLCKIEPITSDSHLMAIYDIVDDIDDNKLMIDNRTRISAEINGKYVTDALNEISIGGINRTVYLRITNKYINELNLKAIGDGIIFSTRTGSTAYNINAGGSVLLDENVFSVVANNSIFQSDKLPVNTKSLITSSETTFNINLMNKNKENVPFLVADGQRTIKLDRDDIITIRKSKYSTKFIQLH